MEKIQKSTYMQSVDFPIEYTYQSFISQILGFQDPRMFSRELGRCFAGSKSSQPYQSPINPMAEKITFGNVFKQDPEAANSCAH